MNRLDVDQLPYNLCKMRQSHNNSPVFLSIKCKSSQVLNNGSRDSLSKWRWNQKKPIPTQSILNLSHKCLHQMVYCLRIINVNKPIKFTISHNSNATHKCEGENGEHLTVWIYINAFSVYIECRSKPINIDLPSSL